tara:strand:- start:552 stop:1610 length:1059 start_codon:yes stop_codon:yes gene_type:complete
MGHFSINSQTTRTLGVALVALLVIGVWGIHLGGNAASRLEARLSEAANAALSGRDHQWASVRMDGQVAILEGRAPSEAARLDAMAAASAAEWSGGGFAGGVTEVRDATIPVDVARDFGLRATASNGRLSMTGEVATEAVQSSLTRYAERLFPAGTEISITVDAEAETGADAEEAAKRVIAELARLDRGALVLAGEHAVLYGTASHAQTAASSVRGATELPPPYLGAAFVGSGNDRFISLIPDYTACGLLILAALSPSDIVFDPGHAELAPRSSTQIRQLGAMLADCPATRLTISGGPDPDETVGSETLSLERANAVRTALVDGGADRNLIETVYADTQAGIIRFETMPLEGG